jgi:hypothetical protein
VAERQAQIELVYLPSYSPQLNPEERLNADLKQEMGRRVPVRTKAKLHEAANEHMAMLDRTPERVIGYFQDRRVCCAACYFIVDRAGAISYLGEPSAQLRSQLSVGCFHLI